ncbi:MAG TPA: PP0621 family protein [Burkholderiaceae bacterium]|nr:PP0621 family protein [Burkholderiaceae bacterium]
MHEPQAFARCAHCGVHLPVGDAVMDRGIAYCSEAHRLAGPKDHGAP